MTPWRRIYIVLGKELTDHLRDRRSLMLALLYPLLAPLLLSGGLYFAGMTVRGIDKSEIVYVPVVGADNAPALAQFMSDNNLKLVTAPADPEQAVTRGRVPIVVIFPPEAKGQESFTVKLLLNLSRVGNVKVSARVADVIAIYNREAAKRIAHAAGLPEHAAAPVTIERISVAHQSNIAVFFYNLMPPLIIFMVFLGGVYLAIDTTVGERERGSLEPLLIAPVERWALLLSKALAALIFTAVTVLANLAGFWLFMNMASASATHLVPPPEAMVFARIFLVALPLMLIAVTLQMAVAVVTRSMKEAQIYLGLLPLVPALPGMLLVFAPIEPTLITSAIPVLGQLLLFNDLVAHGTLEPSHAALSALTTTALSALIFLRAVRLSQW